MDQSVSERTRPDINTDWEESFHLFENVIAYENEGLQVQATIKLARLSNHAPEDILIRTVPILVDLLGRPLSNLTPPIQEVSAYCLKCITCQGEGRLTAIIGQSGAIPSLLSLLPDSEGSFKRMLLKCLRNIVSYGDPNRKIAARNGGLEIILNMLNSCHDNLRRILLEILSALALLREARRSSFILGAIPLLVESARSGSMISRTRAAQALGLLGLVRRSRRTLVDSGAIDVLMELLRVGDTSTKLVAGNALGVISSHVDFIRPLAQAGAIPLYAELLEGSESLGKDIAEDVFCILAVSEENGITIVEHLARILRGDNDEAKAAAADVLWDLSSYKHLSSALQSSGAITILVELLTDGNGDVREKASAAVAQLSNNKAGRVVLADSGAIPLLSDMLQDESVELRENATEALINFSEDPLLCDRISGALDLSSFQNMQDTLIQIRHANMELALSTAQMSIEHLTWNTGLH